MLRKAFKTFLDKCLIIFLINLLGYDIPLSYVWWQEHLVGSEICLQVFMNEMETLQRIIVRQILFWIFKKNNIFQEPLQNEEGPLQQWRNTQTSLKYKAVVNNRGKCSPQGINTIDFIFKKNATIDYRIE